MKIYFKIQRTVGGKWSFMWEWQFEGETWHNEIFGEPIVTTEVRRILERS